MAWLFPATIILIATGFILGLMWDIQTTSIRTEIKTVEVCEEDDKVVIRPIEEATSTPEIEEPIENGQELAFIKQCEDDRTLLNECVNNLNRIYYLENDYENTKNEFERIMSEKSKEIESCRYELSQYRESYYDLINK